MFFEDKPVIDAYYVDPFGVLHSVNALAFEDQITFSIT